MSHKEVISVLPLPARHIPCEQEYHFTHLYPLGNIHRAQNIVDAQQIYAERINRYINKFGEEEFLKKVLAQHYFLSWLFADYFKT